jgi:hypothetical protein
MINSVSINNQLSGITVESLFDDKVCCLSVSSSTREVIDEFAAFILKRQENWPEGTKVYYVFDFTSSFAGFNTPYGRARIQDMDRDSSHLISYSAIVLPNTFLLQISRMVINNFQRKTSTNRIFTSRAEAIKWIGAVIASNEGVAN